MTKGGSSTRLTIHNKKSCSRLNLHYFLINMLKGTILCMVQISMQIRAYIPPLQRACQEKCRCSSLRVMMAPP